MNEMILRLIEDFGYLLFFMAMALGPFGIPVPNEITVLTGGILSAADQLNPSATFFSILAGLLTATTVIYWIGRLFGFTLLERMRRKGKFDRAFARADRLVQRHGNKAMFLACFVPFVRYAMPLFVGASRVPFRKLMIYTYGGVVVWSSLFFLAGAQWGADISAALLQAKPIWLLTAGAGAVLTYVLVRIWKHQPLIGKGRG